MYHTLYAFENGIGVYQGYILDYFYMLIPSQIFPSKFEFLALENLQQNYSLTPYGTYFLPGSILLSSSGEINYFFNVIFLLSLISIIWKYIKNSKYWLYLIPNFMIFVGAYPIRGTIAGGLKIFTYQAVLLSVYTLLCFSIKRK